jgi:TolA-binding protein
MEELEGSSVGCRRRRAMDRGAAYRAASSSERCSRRKTGRKEESSTAASIFETGSSPEPGLIGHMQDQLDRLEGKLDRLVQALRESDAGSDPHPRAV